MDKFDASSSILGYLYQIRQALLLLLKSDQQNQIVIEGLDDIEFQEDGSPVSLYQLKRISTKSSGNLMDSSEDIWKTIRIWATRILEGSISINDTILTIITTGKASEGSIAGCLRVSNGRDVPQAVNRLREIAQTSKNKQNEECYKVFLKLSEIQQIELVEKIRVIDYAPDIETIESLLIRELRFSCESRHARYMLEHLEGWWLEKVINHLQRGNPGSISFRELDIQITNIRTHFLPMNLPADFHRLVLSPEEQSDRNHMFINQLMIIGTGPSQIDSALLDYYKAAKQRLKWVREGVLPTSELEDYESELKDRWKTSFESIQVDLISDSSKEEKMRRGRQLYELVNQHLDIRIRQDFSYRYFQRGSYQILSEQLIVGWHVDFKSLLTADEVAER